MKVSLLAILALAATSSGAERTHKAPLNVDFNQLIDEGNLDRVDLAKAAPEVGAADAPPVTSNRRKVIDFIDLEVSVGAESSVVDSK